MLSEIVWPEPDDLVQINEIAVSETGEPHFLRSAGLLEMAIHHAYNMHAYKGEQRVGRLAVALLFGIANLHPFTQGNMRTGWAAFGVLLLLNGLDLGIPDYEDIGTYLIQCLPDEEQGEEAFYRFLYDHIVPSFR